MKTRGKRGIILGVILILAFVLWTGRVMFVNVKPLGVNGSDIGLADINTRFHAFTGVHMRIYDLTDLLGLVPILVCIGFIILGCVQLFSRRSLKKVDADILLLGLYYFLVIAAYLFFEFVPINYRPILIEGEMEASYPSSTTLLVLSVMPTLAFQVNRRVPNKTVRTVVTALVVLFSAFMVISRMLCGVHWLSDIIGGVLLSCGLYLLYRSVVTGFFGQKGKRERA